MAGENQQNENQKSENQKSDARSESPAPHGGGGVLGAIYRGAMRDGTLAALGREGLKDIQDTFHEAAWGQHSHGREPGAPLTPLHRDIAEAREQYRPPLPSPSDIAKGRNGAAMDRDQTTVHGRMDAPQPSPGDIPTGQDVSPQQQEGTVHGRASGSVPSPGDIAKGQDGNVHGKGETQYAMGALFGIERGAAMAEAAEAEAAAERAAEAAAARTEGAAEATADNTAEGNAMQGQAPRPGSFAARELERKANSEGNKGGYTPAEERSLADEQKAAKERDDRGRGR